MSMLIYVDKKKNQLLFDEQVHLNLKEFSPI